MLDIVIPILFIIFIIAVVVFPATIDDLDKLLDDSIEGEEKNERKHKSRKHSKTKE